MSLTVKEVAGEIRAHENYVRDQLNSGIMGGWRLGKEWRVEEDDLTDWKRRMRPGAKKVSRLRAVEDVSS